MKRSIAIAQKSTETEIDKRKKIIREILSFMPLKYKNIVNKILHNDLNKLAEFCKGFYKPTIKKLLGPLIHKRAHENGLFVQIREITKDLNMKRSKFLHYQKILEDEGFFKNDNKELSQDSLLNAAFNVAWKLKDANLVSYDEISNLKDEIKFLLHNYPQVWLTRGKLDKVLTLLAFERIKPGINSKKLCLNLSGDKKEAADLFKRIKSARNRINS